MSLKQMSLQQKPPAAALPIGEIYQRGGARRLLKERRTASMREYRMERVLMKPFCSSRARTISKTCGRDSVYMQHIKRERIKYATWLYKRAFPFATRLVRTGGSRYARNAEECSDEL